VFNTEKEAHIGLQPSPAEFFAILQGFGNKVWGKSEKTKSGKNVKNSRGKVLKKNVEKIGVERTWKNDLEEVKSVEKYYISSCGTDVGGQY
jgi:hypothetical protein